MSRAPRGLNPNLRLAGPDPEPLPVANDVMVELGDDDADVPEYDDSGAVIRIEHGDGSVTVSLDGKPIQEAEDDGNPEGWFANLVERIDDAELGRISEDLLRGIEDDLRSRQEWIETRAEGLKLLGLKIEVGKAQGTTDDAPVEGMSKVRHPLLLEAVLRFQANARSELLPTDGPLKIRDDANQGDVPRDQLADALEKDVNHYLTDVATEYYPDTDRMLLLLGFGGTAFKKVYFCPLRNRPVSESVDADDLIVNNSATDLANAKRVTHRVFMRPSTVARLQILGVYRDIDLPTPLAPKSDSLRREKKAQQGVDEDSPNPLDRDREIYECYCELNLKGFEHKHKGRETGLELPYRVTIDVSSRQILSLVRNYDEETAKLPVARKTFVKYPYIPGFGFYDIGLVHILGNTTNAITAAWREMLDNGMFANFPGGLVAQAASRQRSNLIRVAPGALAPIDTQGMAIRDAVMPLPYNTQQMAPLMSLVDNMAQTGQRIGGAAEVATGEGTANTPVGTILAMIEQATKVENAVHKRLYSAQAEEFRLLLACFEEHPEAFWQSPTASAFPWDETTFLQALRDVNLVPQADPNTASHTQRMLRAAALGQLVQQNPMAYKVPEVQEVVIKALGYSNPERFINPNPQPDPKAIQAQAGAQADKTRADAAMVAAQAKQAEVAHTAQQGGFAPAGLGAAQQPQGPDPIEVEKLRLAHAQLDQKRQDDLMEAENRERDRESDERVAAVKLLSDLLKDPAGLTFLQLHGLIDDDFIKRLESNETPIAAIREAGGGGE